MSGLRTRPIRQLSSQQAAYIAGILDGEGYVCISKKRDPSMRYGYCFRPLVGVTNTNRSLLLWMRRVTGLGSTHEVKRLSERHKTAWVWQLWSNQALQLLRVTRAFLLIKRRQADWLIKFCEAKRDGPGRDGLTAKEWAFQHKVYARLRVLNRRGVLP